MRPAPWRVALRDRLVARSRAVAMKLPDPCPVALLVLLAACGRSASSDGVVVLESGSYGCGVEEGLGCGLALAPVLATLDDIEGVEHSAVSWDGRRFRITLEPGADGERVAAAAASVLEGDERRVAAATASGGADEHWWNAEGTVALSRHEAGVLGADLAADLVVEAELGDEDARRLATILHEELEGAFERAHAAGGGIHRLWEELPAGRAAFEERLEFLDAERRARVAAFLDRELGK